MEPEICLLLLFSCMVHQVSSGWTKVDYLYYSSPESADLPAAGVYGGHIDFRDNGSMHPLIDHHCLQNRRSRKDSLPVKFLSYDQVSRHFVMQVDESNDRRLTVLRAPVCSTKNTCFNSSANVLFHRIRTDHRVGPLIMHDSRVYFIRTVKTRAHSENFNVIELRVLDQKCENRFPVINPDNYDLEECSQLVATLVDEEYEEFEEHKPTSGLLAITNDRNQIEFFTQLQKLHYENGKFIDKGSLKLMHINHNGKVSTLHTQRINKNYFKYLIKHLGGLAYRNGKICWSMADTIKCADWSRGRLVNPRIILFPGNASKACEGGAGSERMFANLTTGVAISNAKNEIALYFGCISESGLAGGAGLVRMPMKLNSQSARVYPLEAAPDYRRENETSRVFGGSMFVTDECKMMAGGQEDGRVLPVHGGATTWSVRWGVVTAAILWTCLASLAGGS